MGEHFCSSISFSLLEYSPLLAVTCRPVVEGQVETLSSCDRPQDSNLGPEPGPEPEGSFKINERDKTRKSTVPSPQPGHSLSMAGWCHHQVPIAAFLGSDKD